MTWSVWMAMTSQTVANANTNLAFNGTTGVYTLTLGVVSTADSTISRRL